jgi:hypothetical protein
MSRGLVLVIAVSIATSVGCASQNLAKNSSSSIPKEKAMQIEDIPFLPFGLKTMSDLESVKIKLAFISAKTGAGKQEITISGLGHVRLFFSRSFQDKSPKIIEGDCEPERVIRLLDLMEGYGLFGLPDEVPGDDQGASQRLLEVVLPGRTKTIFLQEADVYTIEQMIGAVKMTAAQCVPEVLNHRLFPNL